MRRTCAQIEGRLAEFVYGGLNQPARAAVAKHLADCPPCRDRVRAMGDERALLRQFVAGLDAGMEERCDKVRQRLQVEPCVERPGEPGLWRRIVRGRMTRLAAAAVLLAGLVLLMHLGEGSLDLSNTALARVATAMNNVPWVHLHTTLLMEGKTRHYESWLSNPLQISAGNDENGRITWSELANRRQAVYHPARNTVVISYASQTPTGNVIHPSAPIDAFRKQHGIGDTAVTCEPGQHDGIDVDIYQATHYSGPDAQRYLRSRYKLVTDRKRHLILVSEQYDYGPDGTLFHSDTTTWDYPQDGPKSLYDIGVPKSAKVLDFSPSPELLKVLDQYEAKRDSFPARYIAVVQHSRYDFAARSDKVDGMDVFYSHGALKRADSLRFQPVAREAFAAAWGDSFETLMNGWDRRGNGSLVMERQSVSLYDEGCSYSTNTRQEGSWRPLQKRYAPAGKDRQLWKFFGQSTVYGDVLAELGYPLRLLGRYYSEPTKISILQDDYAKDNACICAELLYDGEINRDPSGNRITVVLPKRSLFYLDPNRDYFCRREEVRYDVNAPWPVDPNWRDGISPDDLQSSYVIFDTMGQQADIVHGIKRAVVVRDVPEYDRTDSGRWYPKKIMMHGQAELYDGTAVERQSMITIHLNAHPTFPDGTFDPSRLPK
jgi:hypothetical protein